MLCILVQIAERRKGVFKGHNVYVHLFFFFKLSLVRVSVGQKVENRHSI